MRAGDAASCVRTSPGPGPAARPRCCATAMKGLTPRQGRAAGMGVRIRLRAQTKRETRWEVQRPPPPRGRDAVEAAMRWKRPSGPKTCPCRSPDPVWKATALNDPVASSVGETRGPGRQHRGTNAAGAAPCGGRDAGLRADRQRRAVCGRRRCSTLRTLASAAQPVVDSCARRRCSGERTRRCADAAGLHAGGCGLPARTARPWHAARGVRLAEAGRCDRGRWTHRARRCPSRRCTSCGEPCARTGP